MAEKIDFEQLASEGKTVIYQESKTELKDVDWEFWGKRNTEEEEVFVYRKIVTIVEAEKYDLENN